MRELELLRAVYKTNLLNGASVDAISVAVGEEPSETTLGLGQAADEGLLRMGDAEIVLTPEGRARLKIVMIGGAFEIIHPGHLHTISEARRLGNTLVVVVAADKTVLKNKQRDPVTTQDWRVKLASALRD